MRGGDGVAGAERTPGAVLTVDETGARSTALRFDAILAESEGALRRLLGEGIALQIRLQASGARVRCDRDQLDRLLMTLVAKARKAIGRRGRLQIETARVSLPGERPQDQTSAAEPGRYLVLTMTKTDLDLDREAPSCLFGASFRLSNAYGIVEQQRGFLQVRGEEGREATLRVYLPCVDEGETAFDTCAGRFAGS